MVVIDLKFLFLMHPKFFDKWQVRYELKNQIIFFCWIIDAHSWLGNSIAKDFFNLEVLKCHIKCVVLNFIMCINSEIKSL